MKNYDYFLFDWDGCLANTLEIWLEAYRQSMAKFGVHATDKEIANQFGNWNGPKNLGVSEADYTSCMDLMDRIVEEKLPHVHLYEGAKQLLEELKAAGKKLALLTSSRPQDIKKPLDNTGVRSYFEVILTADDVTSHKPHPEVIEKALKELGGEKAQAVMIGDSAKDIEAAKNAGVDSILVFPKQHEIFYDFDKLKAYGPTHIVSGFGDLVKGVKEYQELQ